MLDQILPVQYIEGTNESAEPTSQGNHVEATATVAWPYTPRTTFTLTGIECFVDWAQETPKFLISVYTSAGSEPGEVRLSGGSYVRISKGWTRLDMSPVVLRKGAAYWIALTVEAQEVTMPVATNAESLLTKWLQAKTWTDDGPFRSCTPMLRFYGRLLPTLA